MPQLELLEASESAQRKPDFESTGILSAVLDAYGDRGYERGYERAVQDLLASLVPLTEQYLRRTDEQSADARRLVYGYIESLEDHLRRASPDAGYVSEGLGI